MRIMPGGIIRKLKINSCAYSGGPTEIQKPGVIPSVQALEVRDDHQCNILLERVGQEEEDIRSTWPQHLWKEAAGVLVYCIVSFN